MRSFSSPRRGSRIRTLQGVGRCVHSDFRLGGLQPARRSRFGEDLHRASDVRLCWRALAKTSRSRAVGHHRSPEPTVGLTPPCLWPGFLEELRHAVVEVGVEGRRHFLEHRFLRLALDGAGLRENSCSRRIRSWNDFSHFHQRFDELLRDARRSTPSMRARSSGLFCVSRAGFRDSVRSRSGRSYRGTAGARCRRGFRRVIRVS